MVLTEEEQIEYYRGMNVFNHMGKKDEDGNTKNLSFGQVLGYFASGAIGSLATQMFSTERFDNPNTLTDLASSGVGGIFSGLGTAITDFASGNLKGGKTVMQYWATGTASVMTGNRLSKGFDKNAISNLWKDAIYVGTENMLTMYGKEETTNIGQFANYFVAGAAGSMVNYGIKKVGKDLKNPLGKVATKFGASLFGDMVTNYWNYYTKYEYDGTKVPKLNFGDLINYKSGYKGLLKADILSLFKKK